ncbi:MAG: fatty acid--CoA ligase [Actinomycetota bacterium]|nr:fatty acid--CoA ligase [Actinomycetota bacterium]
MDSTMMDVPLTVGMIMRHGTTVHGDSEVVTWTSDGARRASYAEVGWRAAQLAGALRQLGVTGDQRVATFQWNNQEHLEAYLAIPSMGAVVHTLNLRLAADQVAWIANHAEDDVVIVDGSLVPLLARALPAMKTVRHVIVVGEADKLCSVGGADKLVATGEADRSGAAGGADKLGTVSPIDTSALEGAGKAVHSYHELLSAQPEHFEWPSDIDERAAAAMCYTSGTTDRPKGVAYSHRSTYLHSMCICTGEVTGLIPGDRILPVVPMFHANAWGLPYAALMAGASLIMPDRFLQAESLVRLIEAERPTIAGAVPTIWGDVLRHLRAHGGDVSSISRVICGGSAVPLTLMKAFSDELGVEVKQGWGMTETSPIGSVATPPVGAEGDEAWRYRASAGRLLAGVEGRVVGDDDVVLPSDGESVGEIEVRGPWVTVRYYGGDTGDPDSARFHDGWLRTGDVGTIDKLGFITISDRAKDVIKSGGEWISSVMLENALMAHPKVVEAAVVAVPDDKWVERPLATVVVAEGGQVSVAELRDHLSASVPAWQLPERWSFITEVPKTSVGKFDKKLLRQRYAAGTLDVLHAPRYGDISGQ